MKCPKCGSENVNVQVVTTTKLKDKHRGLIYWFCFGWLIDLMLWFFLTIPRLFVAMFGHKKQKIVQKQHSMAVCQDCGHNWKV